MILIGVGSERGHIHPSQVSFVDRHTEISIQNSDEYRLLVEQNGIEIVSPISSDATIQESAFFLFSGDKKCLNALVAKDLNSIHKKCKVM